MSKRKVGNLLALAVLSYLTQRPMHPYEMSRLLRDNGDARSIKYTHGSLYMVFEQLTRAGFITAQETTREGQRPERTVYSLTDAGRQELLDWLRELVSEPHHEYPQFIAAIALIGALPPGEVPPLLRHRLDRLAEQRAEIGAILDETAAAGVPELFVMEEQYRLALLNAEVGFLQEFLAKLEDPGTAWVPIWAGFHANPAVPQQNPVG